ncbi:hypothetical protein CFC21_094462 [Triticum aestivum]|uniref:Uncharacterized protein n=2 Tax=Triticum aestivum TaxID=4565 RepID=A0A9R1LN71_WHEAT|nr:hypothetical protein CFC21_094462 [Triticum aestivum]
MGERKEATVPSGACVGGGSGGSGSRSSSCKRASAVCKISKRSQQGIFKKMKPIAAYFGTPPSNEFQAPVHVPEPDANILSTEASDANIVEDLVPEPEVYNEGSHDNTLQTSILGFSCFVLY